MPRLITLSIVAAMSKKRRMPDGGTERTRSEIKLRDVVSCFMACLSFSLAFVAYRRRVAHVDRAEAPFDVRVSPNQALTEQRLCTGCALIDDRIAHDAVGDLAVCRDGHVRPDHRCPDLSRRDD